MIDMTVRQGDSAEPAARGDLSGEDVEMRRGRRARIDEPGRVTANDPTVGASQAEDPRVVRAEPHDVAFGNLESRHGRRRLLNGTR